MNDYLVEAENFAKKHGIKLTVLGENYIYNYFNDERYRYVFKLRLTRNKKTYTFTFGQSIADGSKRPNMYDVLATLTKYNPYSFEDFCSTYGYDNDSISALKTYKAVQKEYNAVQRLFGDIIDELMEIP